MIASGPPSYSPYGSKVKYRQLGPEDSRNPLWRNWGTPGVILGSILLLFGISMIPIEVSRIIRGSLNRGDRGSYFLYPNYNVDANAGNAQIIDFLPDIFSGSANVRNRLDKKGIVPFSAESSSGVNNFPIQDKYLWPWSHAALLFCLVTITAGGLGILSGCRRTYSSVFAFFTLSLISALLSIFLIAYYATQVYWQLNQNADRRLALWSANIDYALGSTMLALSCAVCVFSFIATIFTGLSLSICCGAKASLRPPNSTVQKGGSNNANPNAPRFVGIKPPPRMVPVPVRPGSILPPGQPFGPMFPQGPIRSTTMLPPRPRV